MVSPKQLDFSSSGGVGDSDLGDATLSRRKSPRTPSSKSTAPEVPEVEEETKKKRQRTDKKKKKKNKKETNTRFSRIWNEEEELTILKGLVDFRAKKGVQSKIDWDNYYRLLGGSIVEKFSKNQVYSKIRKLRKKYFVCMEKINQQKDPQFTTASDSEAFGYSQIIWGQNEAPMDKEMLNEVEEHVAGTENETGGEERQSKSGELKEHEEEAHDESLKENEAVAENVTASGLKEQEEEAGNERLNGNEAVTESGTARQAHQIETGEEMTKHQDEEADVENRSAKRTETNDAKEGQDDNDELYGVQDAFQTLISQGLSHYQKKIHLEKLVNIGTDKMRELSNEWETWCDEERSLNLKKLRFSTKLAEAVFQ